MIPRIHALREQSVGAQPSISPERAILITEFYRSPEAGQVSVPVRRALAFRHIMVNKTLYIGDGELIVGERGPAPRATPTYPEACIHSLEDLDMLDTREKTPYAVDDETKRVYESDIIPY